VIRNAIILTAKRFILHLKIHDIPVSSAWLFGSFATGTANEESPIEIAIVLGNLMDTVEVSAIMKLQCKIDLRINPHLININDFTMGNPYFEEIKSSGIALI
jgi:predicted nucleotidyltransferase